MTPSADTDRLLAASHAVEKGLNRMESAREQVARPLIYSDIQRYVNGDVSETSVRVEQALGSDLVVRRQYRDLLERAARMKAPVARAASSETNITTRETDDFTLKLVEARGRQQRYLVLSFRHQDAIEDGRELVLHVITPRAVARCTLPAVYDGKTQLVVDESDPVLSLLTDVDAELFIR